MDIAYTFSKWSNVVVAMLYEKPLFKNSIWTLQVHDQCDKIKEDRTMDDFTRALGEKEYNHNLSTSEAELTDVELTAANGGCGGGCSAGGGAFYGGPVYGGAAYGSPACVGLIGGPAYGGPAYGAAFYGGPTYGGSIGCPQVIVVQQPDQSITPPPPPVNVPPQIGAPS